MHGPRVEGLGLNHPGYRVAGYMYHLGYRVSGSWLKS